MTKTAVTITLVLASQLAPVVSTPLGAQIMSDQLLHDQTIERSLSGGESHAYSVALEAGQFLFVTVEQRGIDVAVTLQDPSGAIALAVDTRNGPAGLEPVALFPQRSGEHAIEVRSLDENSGPGRYAITLERLEPAAPNLADRVDQMFATWDRPGSPGAAIAVVKDGEIILERGYGLANLEYDVPITPATVFHVASVSKQFTAFAITMLAVQGALSLDDDIREYIPELHDFGHVITIRQLLHHTSGLRDQWNLLALAGWRLDDVITHDQILRLIARQRELNFEPGAEYLYCNTGFTLLAEIVSRVTGQPFPEWTAKHMFRPLGMTDTHFHYDHETIVPGRAYSYQFDTTGGFRKSVLSYANVGATSLFTTAEDLAKWTTNFETGGVGGPEVIRLMRTRGVLNSGDTLDYAFGQAIGSYKGLRVLSHSGADAGFRSYLLRFPHQRVSVAVLSNLASFDPGRLARQVADFYLADQFNADVTDDAAAAERSVEAVAVDPELFDSYVGDYELQPGVILTISSTGDQLFVDATGRRQVRLIAASDKRFFVAGTDSYIDFERNADGIASRLKLVQEGRSTAARRIEPFDTAAVPLAEYAGEFYAEELGTSYSLVVADSTLLATHVRHDPITLTPTSPDAFASTTWFLSRLVFERNDAGAIAGFHASSGRVRDLWFARR
jgi:CubicO group peptidase (beta-lactamase class C family)